MGLRAFDPHILHAWRLWITIESIPTIKIAKIFGIFLFGTYFVHPISSMYIMFGF